MAQTVERIAIGCHEVGGTPDVIRVPSLHRSTELPFAGRKIRPVVTVDYDGSSATDAGHLAREDAAQSLDCAPLDVHVEGAEEVYSSSRERWLVDTQTYSGKA